MADGTEKFREYFITEYLEQYEERRITRREVLKLLAGVTGSLSVATALVAACSPAPAPPAATATSAPPTATARPSNTAVPDDRRVAANDPAVRAEMVPFPSGSDSIMGYLARPAVGNGPFPGMLVCWENRGLNDHIKDVTRRYAKSGYAAIAVDLISREGGTDKVSDLTTISGMISNVPPSRHVNDFIAAGNYLKAQSYVNKDRLGMTGFCFGGGITWMVATEMADLKAAVPFYGTAPDIASVPKIRAAVFGVYAGNDPRINMTKGPLEEALKANNKTYQMKEYPGASHQFHNDTVPAYNPEAARQAWSDALAWFDKYLKAA